MHSNVTIKNVSWPHFSWPTLYNLQCISVSVYQQTVEPNPTDYFWVDISKNRTDIGYFKIPIPIPTAVFTIPKNAEYRR